MEATARVIVQHGPNEQQHWRRFAAVMCFILFYYHFVTFGSKVWNANQRWIADIAEPNKALAFVGMITTIAFYLAGRTLTLRRTFSVIWLIIPITNMILIRVLQAADQSSHGIYIGPFAPYPGIKLQPTTAFLVELARDVPWMGVCVVGLWCSRSAYQAREHKRPVWVWMALAWCAGQLAVLFLHNSIEYELRKALASMHAEDFALPMSLILPALTILLLYTAKDPARFTSFTHGSISLALAVFNAFWITELFHSPIIALLASSNEPFNWYIHPLPLGSRFMSHDFFVWVFVEPVLHAGPWFVIAVFVWRAPLRVPADDGSPYPRRYCGHCHYNLQGIASERCPECGRALVFDE